MKQVSYLNPFGRFCCTIGNLPSSYMESLTYEQQLLWFLKFLDEKVIPAVNTNADAIVELQNYLKNLDLQDEVNNKLDEMAESGELTEIIAQYLQLAGLLCYNTVADLKNAENLVDGSFAQTFGFYNVNDGGHAKYKIRKILNTDVVDEMSIIALKDDSIIAELIIDDELNMLSLGTIADGSHDNTDYFKKAVELSKNIYVPNGYYIVNEPIIINNQGYNIHGSSNATAIIYCNITGNSYQNNGLFEYHSTNDGDTLLWGIVIKHLHLIGNNSKINALYFKNIGYPLIDDINIEQFDGAGILLDKVQDGSFNNINIQLCGRTHGDPTNNADTDVSALHLISTIVNDACNMIRFNDCQIENNNCSPYIYVEDGIGINFNCLHSEIRESAKWNNYDLLKKDAGDVTITNSSLSKFRYGIVDNGYGSIIVSDCREVGSYIVDAQNVSNSQISFTNSGINDFTYYGRSANNFAIKNCSLDSLTLSYLSGKSYVIQDCYIKGNVDIGYSGSNADVIIKLINNIISGTASIGGELNTQISGNKFGGNVSVTGGNKSYFDNMLQTGITETLDFNSMLKYIPSGNRIVYGTLTPYGSWNVGDIIINNAPASNEPIGWVCVTAGTGTDKFKAFGTIE